MGRKQGQHPSLSAVCHPLDLWPLGSSKNYEDSVRRRYELSQKAARNDSAAKMLIKESEEIRKRLK